jgi:hypothetical protein
VQALIAFPLPIEENMPVREDQKEFIRGEIERQMIELADSFRPHGWTKVTHFLREWGLTGTAVIVPLTLLGLTLGALYQSWGHVKEETEFRTHTNDRLGDIDASLKIIRSQLDGMSLKRIASNPLTAQTITEAKDILVGAASNKIQIDQNVVKDVGRKFVEASEKDPAAWNAAMMFLEYRSVLNGSFLPLLRKHTGTTTYQAEAPPGHTVPNVSHYGDAPPSQAAILEKIGTELNKNAPVGDAFLLLQDGDVELDNYHAKNIIFRNIHIMYRGGPVQLENVYFVNCTFEIVRQPSGVEFAEKVLEPTPSTDFAVG